MQLDIVKPRVQTAYGVCNQRLRLESHKLLPTFAFKLNLRRHNEEEHDYPALLNRQLPHDVRVLGWCYVDKAERVTYTTVEEYPPPSPPPPRVCMRYIMLKLERHCEPTLHRRRISSSSSSSTSSLRLFEHSPERQVMQARPTSVECLF